MSSSKRRMSTYAPGFSPGQEHFIKEYLIDCSPTKAAARAGYPDPDYGYHLIQNPRIRAAITARMGKRAGKVEVEQDFVLRRWLQLATADARELQSVWFVPCRHCWGVEHSYQFNDIELRNALAQHRYDMMKLPEEKRREFDEQGGGGYTINKKPCRGPDWVKREQERYEAMGRPTPDNLIANSEESCPVCYGDGVMHPWVADMRELSPAAATLYNGFKITKDGSLQILVRDRSHAEDMLAQHLGMLVQRNVNMNLDLFKLTEEQLNEVLKQVTDSGLITIENEAIEEPVDGDG